LFSLQGTRLSCDSGHIVVAGVGVVVAVDIVRFRGASFQKEVEHSIGIPSETMQRHVSFLHSAFHTVPIPIFSLTNPTSANPDRNFGKEYPLQNHGGSHIHRVVSARSSAVLRPSGNDLGGGCLSFGSFSGSSSCDYGWRVLIAVVNASSIDTSR